MWCWSIVSWHQHLSWEEIYCRKNDWYVDARRWCTCKISMFYVCNKKGCRVMPLKVMVINTSSLVCFNLWHTTHVTQQQRIYVCNVLRGYVTISLVMHKNEIWIIMPMLKCNGICFKFTSFVHRSNIMYLCIDFTLPHT